MDVWLRPAPEDKGSLLTCMSQLYEYGVLAAAGARGQGFTAHLPSQLPSSLHARVGQRLCPAARGPQQPRQHSKSEACLAQHCVGL
eukprot:7282084-Alexandrium_andersonii.AAC.1